jgi:phosphatidylinositol 4-kinase
VLNSAERAPYLLLIEIIHDDLDFDPSKRANKEVLRKIVSKEEKKKGTSKDLVPFGRGNSKHSDAQMGTDYDDLTVDSGIPRLSPPTRVPSESLSQSDTFRSGDLGNPEEEIDLVEQLYGTGQPLRSANLDLAESIVLPPAPKNRDLDMAAWSSTANVDDAETSRGSSVHRGQTGNGNADPSSDKSTLSPIGQVNGGYGILSLDEYFERMRTAAIMLAQLNANLVRDQIATPYSAPVGGPLLAKDASPSNTSLSRTAWIPGSGWLMGSSPLASDSGQPSPSSTVQTPVQGRMRLQHAEAQQIRDRIMKEMLALEEERMERMKENKSGSESGSGWSRAGLGIRGVDLGSASGENSVEDEGIIRRELNKADPSAVVFSESWTTKKVRSSPCYSLARLSAFIESDKSRIALWTSWCVR